MNDEFRPCDMRVCAVHENAEASPSFSLARFWSEAQTRGSGVRIAVVDSGVLRTHKILRRAVTACHNYTSDPEEAGCEHGTHVCGIVCGSDEIGVCPDAEVHSFKVFGTGGRTSSAIIRNALQDILDEKYGRFDVVNLSLGSRYPDDAMRRQLMEITANGTVVVAAAGNDGDHLADNAPRFGTTAFPGAFRSTICVGSIGGEENRSGFSSTGPRIHIMGPGERVISSWPTSETALAECSGTSMAAPFVAGVAGVLISAARLRDAPEMGLEAMVASLTLTAKDIESYGHDLFTGFGLIRPEEALRQYLRFANRAKRKQIA